MARPTSKKDLLELGEEKFEVTHELSSNRQ